MKRISDLLSRLEILERTRPPAAELALREVAWLAIQDEISHLVRDPWLSVYRNGQDPEAGA